MSRIGKIPVAIPSGVKAAVAGNVVTVEGPKGKLDYRLASGVSVAVENSNLQVSVENDIVGKLGADFGTARATLNNMVIGVSQGWKRSLELIGVGFNAEAQGQKITLSVGFSHKVVVEIPKEVKATVRMTGAKTVVIDLESPNREVVGTLAQKLRKIQPPEPYLGKGIRYMEETVRRKAGKTGKK